MGPPGRDSMKHDILEETKRYLQHALHYMKAVSWRMPLCRVFGKINNYMFVTMVTKEK